MEQKPPSSKIARAIAIAVFIALIVVILFTIHHGYLQNDSILGVEPFKLIFQFLLIVVTGGAVSLLFSSYSKAREKQDKHMEKEDAAQKEERALQLKFFNDFIQAYNDGKKIRRFL